MVIGIIGAMEEEISGLKELMSNRRDAAFASMLFCRGELCGRDVVVVRSGIGKVNAAACAQILADRFGADVIINTGVAGSLDREIDIGDVVVATDLVEHDMDCTIFGDPAGQVPGMDTFSFPTDPELVEKAVEANMKSNPDIRTFTGRIVSGDRFVSSGRMKEDLAANFRAKCTEMEGAAIAHVAYLNRIPALVIRAISDRADDGAPSDYPAFEKRAAGRSVKLVTALLPCVRK